MPRFKLLKSSTRGRKGEVVNIESKDAIIGLRRHGIIGEAEADRSPEVKKVREPEAKKEGKGKKSDKSDS